MYMLITREQPHSIMWNTHMLVYASFRIAAGYLYMVKHSFTS